MGLLDQETRRSELLALAKESRNLVGRLEDVLRHQTCFRRIKRGFKIVYPLERLDKCRTAC